MVTARKPRRSSRPDADRDALTQRLAESEARCSILRTALRQVLATLPNEWAPAEVQAVRRQAKAVVEETGRVKP